MSSKFRTDINGLRAWAVLLVILFHFGVPGFGAGFVGVDVFFVISGYLMAAILYRDLAAGQLSLVRFYASRMRRIYPALLVLCLGTLVIGWFLLMPEDYEQLGRHVRESVTFTSNYQYLSEAGYFDVAAENKWLLHTWSLSVEWQFYLLYPLFILALYRLTSRPAALLGWTLIFAALSLAWNQYTTLVDPDEAFYGFPGRAWELLLGAATFHLSQSLSISQRTGRTLHYVGLGLIILAACVVTPAAWPGSWALLPTLGAALLIFGNSHSRMTAGKFWDWCGKRTYSLYLWHWPVVVLLHYFLLARQPLWQGIGILASALLAEISYRLVEQPGRRWLARRSVPRGMLLLLPAILLMFTLGQAVRHDGFAERLPAEIVQLVDPQRLINPRQDECLEPTEACVYGAGPVGLILAGDSHADAVVTAAQAALASRQVSVLFKGDSSCLPLPGLQHTDPRMEECLTLGNALPDVLSDYPEVPLLLVTHLTPYLNGGQVDANRKVLFIPPGGPDTYSSEWFASFEAWYISSLCKIMQERPVWLLHPIPEMAVDVATTLGRQRLLGIDTELSLPRAEYDQRNAYTRQLENQVAAECGVQILDVSSVLCDDTHCQAVREGLPLYRDTNHLSEYGNRLLIPLFERILP